MTDALPKGLIVKTEGIDSNIERLDGVDVADIAQLWRVYTTNTNFVDDESGARLENFFWRVWGSRSICQTIQGPTLARLFARISDGSASIRTTPVPSPPKSVLSRRKDVGLFTPLAPLSDSPANPALPSPPQAHTGSGSSNGTSNEKPKTPSDAARAPLPPPILKKARADSDDPPKTTRIVVPDPDTASPNRPTQSEKNAPNQGRKKTVFVATGANSKRRPLLSRRKSSRSPSSNTPSAKQSPAPTPLEGTSPAEEGPMNPQRSNLSSAIAISSNNPSSSGSWQDTYSLLSNPFPSDVKSTPSSTSKSQSASNKTDSSSTRGSQSNQPSTDTLVDKDFRTRFAEKKIRELGLSSSPGTMMPPPPLPQQQQQQQSTQTPPSKKKESEKQNPLPPRIQAQRSASTPISPQAETSSTTAPVSAATPRRDASVHTTSTGTPSPSVSSSKSQSQLSTLIEADRRKKMAGS